MPNLNVAIKYATNTQDLKAQMAGASNSIIAMKEAADKTARSLGGEGLMMAAHKTTAAVHGLGNELGIAGGVMKLTTTEKERINAQLTKAIEKYGVLGQTAPQAMMDLEQATRKVEEPTRTTFAQMATAVGAVAGLVTGLAAGIAKLGERGAGVADVKQHFADLTTTMGESADVMLGKLKVATLGNISDMDLMKTTNLAFSQGLKLTSDQMGTVGDVAAVLADRIGGDVSQSFDTLMQAMATGNDKTLKTIGLNIDAASATERYAESLRKPVSELTEFEKKTAIQNAILGEGQRILAQSGKAQIDFADKVAQSRTGLSNFVDKVSEWVATNPSIGAWSSGITAASSTVTAFGLAFGPVSTGLTKLLPLLGLGGGLTGAFASLGTVITATVIPALGTTFALLSPFLLPLAAVAAAIGAVYLAWQNWSAITDFVKRTYEGVRDWLGAKLGAVFDAVKAKVDAVIGYFANMYDAVIGHSWVPETIDGIATEFGRLDSVMVGPTREATTETTGLFQQLSSESISALSQINPALGGAFSSGMQAASGWAKVFSGDMSGLSDAIVGTWNVAKSVGSAMKNLFGGPSAIELGGREVAREFEKTVNTMFDLVRGRVEPAHEQWQRNNILLREAYIKLGHDGPAAIAKTSDMMTRLHLAEKQGADATRRVMQEIIAVLNSGLTPAAEQFGATFSDAAVRAQYDLIALGGVAAAVKDSIASPVTIPVTLSSSGGGNNHVDKWQGSGMDSEGRTYEQWRSDFERDNPGGVSSNQMAEHWAQNMGDSSGEMLRSWGFDTKGWTGFAGGTQGKLVNFGERTPVNLHGWEQVRTEKEVKTEGANIGRLVDRVERLVASQGRQAKSLEEAIMRAFTYGPAYARAR